MKYAVWNNKGGVGKSFLTFIFATEYAVLHPDKTVYVIDMCPQANVSEMLLGGNSRGTTALDRLLQEDSGGRRTIGGYFDTRIKQPHSKTGDETNFTTAPHDDNENIPANILLVAGDPSLEVQTEAINQIANQSLPQDTWRNVHSWLNDLCTALESKIPDSIFFIDCNPSFAAYTELSVVAADKLIVPCSADGSSARAIDNLGQLVYGHNVPPQYKKAMFAARLKTEGLSAPSIAMIILNRSTQYDRRASKAFGAMFGEIKKRAGHLLESEPLARGAAFGSDYFYDIPDTHSVAIVASHHGIPIHKIEVRKYQVFDKEPQVNGEPLQRYKNAIWKAVGDL